ncbi:hypothetical protein BDZ97DRAFT_1809094 [Flammula alnicola]|nr:hypothetical protein BDZ97DRAFT_1809094 [Flammula alnicola]
MNRIRPSLLYLTIYNPTLRPSGPIEDDNEDAEEQAHILFYTSKERAVSRDRMLRQIGLAKALINFAELFDSESSCDNVHSQSRRMVMVSPEPGFWIHAGVEVAKVPRVADLKNKPKPKGKAVDKGEKGPLPVYDYEDGSVHDGALRAHILKGYERFKLAHGSFTSILSILGQQALELQLERFWTVWAWSWDLEERSEFGEDFGPLLHPCFSSLIPIVDEFSSSLSPDTTPVVLTRLHIIPSERYIEGRYPAALAAHLSSMIPPRISASRSSDTLNTLASSVDTIRGKRPPEASSKGSSNADGGVNFLGMPAINMNMDMRKWNWPGYLTFGKGNSSKSSPDQSSTSTSEEKKEEPLPAPDTIPREPSQVEVEVNTEALEDAIASDSLSIASKDRNGLTDSEGATDASPPPDARETDTASNGDGPIARDFALESPKAMTSSRSEIFSNHTEDTPPPSPPPFPEFAMTKLHLAPYQDPTVTRRVTISYLIVVHPFFFLEPSFDVYVDHLESELMLALINTKDEMDESQENIKSSNFHSVSDSLPSATKILQPQDRYLISTGQYTHGSPGFTSTSSHLFNAKAILDKDPEIVEHWHIAKRGLGGLTIDTEKRGLRKRKETSLTDVDNVLVGVVKKSGLVDGTPGSR